VISFRFPSGPILIGFLLEALEDENFQMIENL
jgi:hypothetical protein